MAKKSCFALLPSFSLGLLCFLGAGISSPAECLAQTFPFLGRVDPERVSPRQMRVSLAAEMEEEASPWVFFGSPLISGSSGSWAGELDLGVSYSPNEGTRRLPFTLLGFGGHSKEVDSGASFNYSGAYGDVTLLRASVLTGRLVGVYSKSTSTRTLSGGASFDVKAGENLGFGATALRSTDKTSEGTTSGWKYEARARVLGPFFSNTGQLSLTPKYTFNPDGEDFYEVGLRLELLAGFKNRSSAVTLSAGQDAAGKNSTVIVGWELAWPGRVKAPGG